MKTLITGALATVLLVPAAANAQEPKAAAVQQAAVSSRVAPPSLLEPRFKVEAVGFRAIDESGFDLPFSDEIIVVIYVPAYNVRIASKVFGDVDAGETTKFAANQSCILPIAGMTPGTFNDFRADLGQTWTCSAIGAAGPIPLFTVEMYEKDDGIIGDCIDLPFDFGCVFSTGPVDSTDDLIGYRRHVWYPTLEELVAVLPNVGDSFEESMKFSCRHGEFGPRVCNVPIFEPTGPEYEFTWRVTRLPDKPVLDQSLVGNSPQADAR
jgi:hypothetical protein